MLQEAYAEVSQLIGVGAAVDGDTVDVIVSTGVAVGSSGVWVGSSAIRVALAGRDVAVGDTSVAADPHAPIRVIRVKRTTV